MIQLAEDVEYLESRKVPIPTTFKKVLIEVAANRKIDLALVDSDQVKEFDESETGDDIGIDWEEKTRSFELEYEVPQDNKKRYLLFWNSNEEDDAVVAYKFTPLA